MPGKRPPRLDQLLVERGLFPSRNRARGAILAGQVYVGGDKVDKAGTRVQPDVDIEVRGKEHPYVGRGGLKLEKALRDWEISVKERICMDVGASTGGFTDCLLQQGARLVFAIDVGYGQLAWKLRQDPRVVVLERLNARYLSAKHLEHQGRRFIPSFSSIDVSFISLQLVLPRVFEVVRPGSPCIALIKPQFEAGPDRVGKGGVVRDARVHRDVLHDFAQFAAGERAELVDLSFSPITGGDGNIEFLAYLRTPGAGDTLCASAVGELVDRAVRNAHDQLDQ